MIENYWPFWFGGIAIAAVAVSITIFSGKFLSVTRGYVSACSLVTKKSYFHSADIGGGFGYRTMFVVGLVLGGSLAGLQVSGFDFETYISSFSFSLGSFDTLFGTSLATKASVLIFGGFLWGFGSRMAGGCTSGNSISGISRGSLSSVVATAGFLVAGIAATYTIDFLFGGS